MKLTTKTVNQLDRIKDSKPPIRPENRKKMLRDRRLNVERRNRPK